MKLIGRDDNAVARNIEYETTMIDEKHNRINVRVRVPYARIGNDDFTIPSSLPRLIFIPLKENGIQKELFSIEAVNK